MKNTAEKHILSRRSFLKLGGAGLAGAAFLGITGCAREQSQGPVRLVFSHGEDSEVLRAQISRFNERNRGEVDVVLRLAPADTGQYFEKLRIEFQTNKADVDIISGDVIWPAQFAAQGWISDLSDLFDEDLREPYLPATIDSNTYEGGVYGVPWFTDAGMFYYRRDLLEESGFSEPPKTWDEMKEMVQKVQQDSGTRYGYVFQGAEYEGGVVNGLEFIWNSGGNVLDSEDLDKVTVTAPKSMQGLQTARSMVTDGVVPGAIPSYKEYESYTVFLNGEAVFMRNWPNVYARGGPHAVERGTGANRGRRAPGGRGGRPELQRSRRVEPHGQHHLQGENGCGLDLYSISERHRTAGRTGIEGRLPADAQRLLREPRDPLQGAGHHSRQSGHPERPFAPGYALLPRYVPGDGRAIPRLARGYRLPGGRRDFTQGKARRHPGSGRSALVR